MTKVIYPIFHPSVRRLTLRSLCCSPMCWPHPFQGLTDVHRTEFLNGIKVACAKTMGNQLAACTIMFLAGSRYEVDDQLGANHFIRVCANGAGCGYSSFAKTRCLQQHGAFMTCSSDRQTISFTLTCPPPYFNNLKYYLLDTAVRCQFHQWDIDDRKSLVRDELTSMRPEQRVLDLIQQASFAGPLANSVFCAKGRIQEMTTDRIVSFTEENLRARCCTIASVGVPFEEVVKMAERIDYSVVYDYGPGRETWVAIAVPGCGTADVTELLKYSTVAAACGTGLVSAGQHELDRWPHAPLGRLARGDLHTHFRAFNISYLDAGIFGILIKACPSNIYEATVKAQEFISKIGDMDLGELSIGKRRLQLSLCAHEESCARQSESLARQEYQGGGTRLDSAADQLAAIDELSLDHVSATAAEIASRSSKMSMAVVGDVASVPLDLVRG